MFNEIIKSLFPTSRTGHDTKWCSSLLLFILPEQQPSPVPASSFSHLFTPSTYWFAFCGPFNPSFCSSPLLLRLPPQGIGRMILKEEMKARSGCHDNDQQWGSRRSSRCSSREALNNVGFSSLNGCKCEGVSVCCREGGEF